MMTPPCRGQLDVVAVMPDTRVALEIRGVVSCAIRDRSRTRAASTGTASCTRAPLSAPTHRPPVARRRLRPSCRARAPGSLRATPAPIGLPRTKQLTMSVPPGDGREVDIALDVVVHEVEALRRKRRSGRRDGADRIAAGAVSSVRSPAFATASMNLADVPNSVMPASSAKSNRTLPSGWNGRAVVQNQRGLRRERRDEPVPHHPAAGREVEDAVARVGCRSAAGVP